MNRRIQIIVATALLLGLAQGARAEEQAVSLAELGSAPARHEAGQRFVWVREIVGRDSAGNRQRLFSNPAGSLLAVAELRHADKLLAPPQETGKLSGLELGLAGQMLLVDARGMRREPLPASFHRQARLRGQMEVTTFEVSAPAQHHPAAGPQSVALLRN